MAEAIAQQDTAPTEQYRAELLRQRARDERIRKQQEKQKSGSQTGAGGSSRTSMGQGVRIPVAEIALMLGVAIIVDALQFVLGLGVTIPIIGWVLGPIGFVIGWTLGIFMALIVFLWLMMKGVSFSKQGGKGILVWFGVSFLVEFIAGFVPTWTGFMLGLLIREQAKKK